MWDAGTVGQIPSKLSGLHIGEANPYLEYLHISVRMNCYLFQGGRGLMWSNTTNWLVGFFFF